VHELLVIIPADRSRHKRLPLATRKVRRAMRARQPADFAVNRANPWEASPVRAATMIQNVIAEDLLLQMVENLLGHLSPLELIFGMRFDDFLLQRIDGRVAGAFFLA